MDNLKSKSSDGGVWVGASEEGAAADGKRKKSRFTGALAAAALVFAVALASCSSAPVPLPADTSSAVIIQKAQDRSDLNDFKGARYYYSLLLQRFPDDQDLVTNAQYELAFIDFKEGHYDKARAGFTAILEKYSAPGGDSLPAAWKILSQKVLAEIPAAKAK